MACESQALEITSEQSFDSIVRPIKPKRPMPAYLIWLKSAREQLKAENPGLSVPEIARKGGDMWRSMEDKSVWQEKAAKAREQYSRDITLYNKSIIASATNKPCNFLDKPKRPMSAYLMWLSNARDLIKAQNPSLNATEVARKGEEMWKNKKIKGFWIEKANKARKKYIKDLRSYKEAVSKQIG